MQSQLFFLHALSPLHAGTGQGVGIVDLPIAREKSTGTPIVPGSSLKGVLKATHKMRARDDRERHKVLDQVFGKDLSATDVDTEGPSAAQFADARLVALPVRSLRGTFAYVTSPHLLERLKTDATLCNTGGLPTVPRPQTNEAFVTGQTLGMAMNQTRQVVLEDLDLLEKANDATKQWANWLAPKVFPADQDGQNRLSERLCILNDDVFNFLCQSATEVVARIKLNETSKTVEKGGLWYEEALPVESLLVSIATATPLGVHTLDTTHILATALSSDIKVAQFGGKAGTGRGLCRIVPVPLPTGGKA